MSHFKKVLITFFIILNLVGMVKLLMPNDSKFISLIYSPVDKYLSAFSIYQDWMMFAPNPNRQNLFISARVDFLDGSHEMYTFPGYKNQSQKDRYIFRWYETTG